LKPVIWASMFVSFLMKYCSSFLEGDDSSSVYVAMDISYQPAVYLDLSFVPIFIYIL
jgi:hypothetical protein